MDEINIAIIDDGLCAEKLSTPVKAYAVVDGCVAEDADCREIPTASHGTVCAKIIEKYCPSGVSFVSIRALNKTGTGSLDDMVTALQWCLTQKLAIINLSNGISWFEDIRPLYEVCCALAKNGVIITAAQNNRRTGTYPADFPFVIGVESIESLKSASLMQSNVYTKSDHKIRFIETEITTQVCNSYACAFAAAQLAAAALGIDNTFSARTVRNYRLSDNAVQWLDRRIGVERFLTLADACSAETPFAQRYDVVLDKKCNFRDLERKFGNIRSVIGFYKLPNGFKKKCRQNGILYWDADYAFAKKNKLEYDVPVILFKTSGAQADFNAIKELEQSFRHEQYVPAVVSDRVDACLYGCFYAPAKKTAQKLSAVEKYLRPDLIFIVSQTDDIKVKYDITVEKKENAYVLSYEGKTERAENAGTLFSSLKRILSE